MMTGQEAQHLRAMKSETLAGKEMGDSSSSGLWLYGHEHFKPCLKAEMELVVP